MSYVNPLFRLPLGFRQSCEPPSPERQIDGKLEVIYCVGGVISPLLAKLYLNPLDHEVARRGWEMVRYADDFVVLCRSKEEAEAVLGFLRGWTGEAGLTLHPTKTRIVNEATEGFDFL